MAAEAAGAGEEEGEAGVLRAALDDLKVSEARGAGEPRAEGGKGRRAERGGAGWIRAEAEGRGGAMRLTDVDGVDGKRQPARTCCGTQGRQGSCDWTLCRS